MKKFIFLFLLCLSVNTYGQEFNKILVGVNFSPEYNYRMLKAIGKGESFDDFIDSRNDFETGKFGYTTGLNIIYNFSKNWGLELGLQYSEKGYQTKWRNPILIEPYDDPLIPSNGWKDIYKYQCIDIPLKANFTFGKNKLRGIVTAGVAANFLIDIKSVWIGKYDNETEKESQSIMDSSYNKFNISPVIGVGVEYQITDKISLRAIPSFKFGLLTTQKDLFFSEHLWSVGTALDEYLWSVGLDFGIYYAIK